jgi:hypothetical protein
MSGETGEDLRCPRCGVGVLTDIAFDAAGDGEPVQAPAARQLVTYSCGHREAGPRLETADADRLAVERRTTPETLDPPLEADAPDTDRG